MITHEPRHIVFRIPSATPSHAGGPGWIKTYLPAGLDTNDIISLDGLALGFDVNKDRYYVCGEMAMGQMEKAFTVKIKDRWSVSGEGFVHVSGSRRATPPQAGRPKIV